MPTLFAELSPGAFATLAVVGLMTCMLLVRTQRQMKSASGSHRPGGRTSRRPAGGEGRDSGHPEVGAVGSADARSGPGTVGTVGQQDRGGGTARCAKPRSRSCRWERLQAAGGQSPRRLRPVAPPEAVPAPMAERRPLHCRVRASGRTCWRGAIRGGIKRFTPCPTPGNRVRQIAPSSTARSAKSN